MQSTASLPSSPMLAGFESVSVNPEASSRRQRISMACQYCRHRKIRCCGAAPCRNCTRSGRQCEYAPVPEEVNRATREKKALSKTKPISSPATPTQPTFTLPAPSPIPTFSPYLLDVPTFDMPYTLPVPPPHLPARPSNHRRTSSAPNFESASWTVPPAPLLNSPAQLESSAWMYNGWSAALPVPDAPSYPSTRAFPSVLEATPVPTYLAHAPTISSPLVPQPYQMMSTPMPSISTMPSIESEYAYGYSIPPYIPAPSYLLPPPTKALNIQTNLPYVYPPTPTTYYTPYTTPSLYSSTSSVASTYTPSPPASSPTLAPEAPKAKEELFGLGFAMGLGGPAIEQDVFYTPVLGGEYISY